jgi:ABC-type cobalamin/Fe3+-siderophores transport system ATPase subunit
MLADVQAHFGLTRPFHGVGNYETEHQRALVREVCAVVQTGRLVVVAGLVGSGKTHLLTRIEEELARSGKIAVAKSLAVDKRRTSLPSLIEAMFYAPVLLRTRQNRHPRAPLRGAFGVLDPTRSGLAPASVFCDGRKNTIITLYDHIQELRAELRGCYFTRRERAALQAELAKAIAHQAELDRAFDTALEALSNPAEMIGAAA